jgi:hypothetical protein
MLAQAEPAPSDQPGPPPPPVSVGFAAGLGVRLGVAATDVPPRLGLSFVTLVGYRYLLLWDRLALGAAVSFGYDQYVTTVDAKREVSPGTVVGYRGERKLSMFDFVALQTFTGELGRVRPQLAMGAGLSIGHLTSPEAAYAPGESRATTALAVGSGGVDVTITGTTDLALRVDYALPFPAPSFHTDGGRDLSVFGPRLGVHLGVRYRF